MNTNPKRDIEGIRTKISCMAMLAIKNILEKGQANGDATKVTTSGELEMTDIQMPNIDARVESHTVSIEGYRELLNGEKSRIKISKEDRKMQLARIEEQGQDLEYDR